MHFQANKNSATKPTSLTHSFTHSPARWVDWDGRLGEWVCTWLWWVCAPRFTSSWSTPHASSIALLKLPRLAFCSLNGRLSVCLSVWLVGFLFVDRPSVCLSVCLSGWLVGFWFVHRLSVCLSVWLAFGSLTVCLSDWLWIR